MKSLKIILVAIALSVPYISSAQTDVLIPIEVINDSTEFIQVIDEIRREKNALYVFDIDNTLLVTNDNGFGSDWWYAQTKTNSSLKIGITNECLFDVLIPLFYAMYETKGLFTQQSKSVDDLGKGKSKTIALTSRGYSTSVATSTEMTLKKNQYSFLSADSVQLAEDVVMQHGIIYTKGQNKGEILLQYIKDKSYDRIFYFDDSLFKVEDVQEAFLGTGIDISLYHMEVAPKIPYTSVEVQYMQAQLCNVIQTINSQEKTTCSCND